MTPSQQTIAVEVDKTNDIIIARPRWTLRTQADVARWFQMWKDVLKPFSAKGKPDIVIVLDEFRIEGEALTLWGEYRARLNNECFGISYRVNSDQKVRITILTSGVAYNAATAEASNVASAIEGILAARRERAARTPAR